MQELLMHLSKTPHLKTLKPLTFENGKNMLCATDNLAFALMMYAKVDKENHPEGNFRCCTQPDGTLVVYEKWENAFFEIFCEKKAYIYFVEKTGAVFNPYVPQFEFYEEIPVVQMIEINNVYAELQKQIQAKKLKIIYYKK